MRPLKHWRSGNEPGVVDDTDDTVGWGEQHRSIEAFDDLLAALKDILPPMPGPEGSCHFGLRPQSECLYCKRVARAHAAIAKAEGAKP
jgi:hypothetical protein